MTSRPWVLSRSSAKLRWKSCTWLFHEDQATGKPRLPIHDLPGHRSVAIWTKAREESRHCPFRRSIWNHVPFCPLPLCVRCRSSLQRPTKFRDLSRVSLRFLSCLWISRQNSCSRFSSSIMRVIRLCVFCYNPFPFDTPLIIEIMKSIVKKHFIKDNWD